jgi:trans-aconitate methyltransferase
MARAAAQADLAELFQASLSDKDRCGYTPLYEILFSGIRDRPLKILEIGIGTMLPDAVSTMRGYAPEDYRPGASLRVWRDYFPNAQVYGIDMQWDCMFSEERIQTFQLDSSNPLEVAEWKRQNPDLFFDVLIEDGSHSDVTQLRSLAQWWDRVTPGGFYITEDLNLGCLQHHSPHVVREIVGNVPIFFAGLKNNQLVIKKTKHLASYLNY